MGGFAVRLSPGLYMQPGGSVSTTPPAGAQIVPSPGLVLPVSQSDLNKVKDALNSVADGIKDASKQGTAVKKLLDDLGISQTELMTLVKQLGEVAATIAKVIPYVGLALSLAETLGLLKKGSTADPAVMQKLTAIDEHLSAIDKKWQGLFAEGSSNAILQAEATVHDHEFRVRGLASIPYQSIQWQAEDAEVQGMRDGTVNVAATALRDLMRTGLWESDQPGLVAGEDGDPPSGWDPLRPFRLFHAPEPNGALVEAKPEQVGKHPQFDHRLMVRAVPAMVQAFLITLATLEPEYRTTGRWRNTLGDLAGLVENLMKVMRAKSVARTHFTLDDVPEFVWAEPGQAPQPPRYDVGGFDLAASRTIAYTWPTPGFAGVWDGGANEVTIGAVTYNWAPPVQWGQPGPYDRYELKNRQAIVERLNAESDQRYASLLQACGYVDLLQTAALLRNQCVPPDTSETVRAGFSESVRTGAGSPVTVTSRSVFPFPPISATASRYQQERTITARLTTQSPLRSAGGVAYRLYLRTLSARSSDLRSDYSTFYRDESQLDVQGVGFRACIVSGRPLAEKQLRLDPATDDQAWTPRGMVEIPSSEAGVTLRADTFDIWVPVPELDGARLATTVDQARRRNPYLQASGTNKDTGGGAYGGWLSDIVSDELDADGAPHIAGAGTQGIPVAPPPNLGDPLLSEPRGQRRNLRRNQLVTVWPSLIWDGPLLTIQLRTAPQLGNFDLYLVLEELLPGGQWRHVHHHVPVVGQLTYVPQSFLDEEAALAEKAERFWRDFDRHYSISEEATVGDKITNLVRGNIRAEATVLALEDAAKSSAPELLRHRIQTWGLGQQGS